jgi:hypothetical protein
MGIGLDIDNVSDTNSRSNTTQDPKPNDLCNNNQIIWTINTDIHIFQNKSFCGMVTAEKILQHTYIKNGLMKSTHKITQNPNHFLKILHQNIRGLRNKSKELYCHTYHDLPHILCLTEHHLNQLELDLIRIDNYLLVANYCRRTILKGGTRFYPQRQSVLL